VFPISSVTGEGIEPLVYHLGDQLAQMPPKGEADTPGAAGAGLVRITLDHKHGGGGDDDVRRYAVAREGDDVLVVSGKGIERMIAMTDMDNEDAVRRLQRRLERLGVFNKLKAAGAREGDTVRIRDVEFDYIDEDAEDDEDENDDEGGPA
jgi:GTP-binding protein